MDTIYIIGIVVFGVLAVYLGVQYFNKQVKLDGEIIEQGTDKVVHVVETILEVLELKDKTEKTIQDILNIADAASHYISEILESNEDKVKASLEAIDIILKANNVEPTESEQKLINIIVDESIKFVEKQK